MELTPTAAPVLSDVVGAVVVRPNRSAQVGAAAACVAVGVPVGVAVGIDDGVAVPTLGNHAVGEDVQIGSAVLP